MLPQTDFERPLQQVPLADSGEIQHLQGPSYIYAQNSWIPASMALAVTLTSTPTIGGYQVGDDSVAIVSAGIAVVGAAIAFWQGFSARKDAAAAGRSAQAAEEATSISRTQWEAQREAARSAEVVPRCSDNLLVLTNDGQAVAKDVKLTVEPSSFVLDKGRKLPVDLPPGSSVGLLRDQGMGSPPKVPVTFSWTDERGAQTRELTIPT